MFQTVKKAQAWIESVHRFGDKYDLIRMENACQMLGHPEKSFKSIHIGGTNGKGSTLSYLKNIYLQSGYRVGTYTSPYIVRFNERITLNYDEISDEELLYYINKIYDFNILYLNEHQDQISFFELVTLISFLYFKDKKPDIVIVEVGLGGTLDATNVITPVASIITNIGTDHQHVLGNTLESIAKNKLGIVKPRVPLFTAYDQEELDDIFLARIHAQESQMYHLKDYPIRDVHYDEPTTFTFLNQSYAINMRGVHQIKNASLAILAANTLHDMNILKVRENAFKKGLLDTFWPGRFEVIDKVILDGAHNVEGIQAFVHSLRTYYKSKKLIVMLTIMQDKNLEAMISQFDSFFDKVIFTEITYARSEKAEKLHSLSKHPNKVITKDYRQALLENMPKNDEERLIITGSLYFISEVRKQLLGG